MINEGNTNWPETWKHAGLTWVQAFMDLGTVLVRSLSGHAVDERALFSFITSSASCSRSRRTSGRNQPSPKDPGGIDESIDLSRDR